MKSSSRKHVSQRRGAIAVLTALLLVLLFAMVAFAVDLGYLFVAKADLQRAADAAAHAAVLEFRSEASSLEKITDARKTARRYVADNKILNSHASIDMNLFNADPVGDVVVGRIGFDSPRSPMTFEDTNEFNAVRVRIRRTTDINGSVPLYFARVLGIESMGLEAVSTAAIINNVGGFRTSSSGENVPFLPITIHEDHWQDSLDAKVDLWSYDASSGTIHGGSDAVPEVVLFPNDTGSAGNFGTLNVGVSSNSAAILGQQIRNGLSKSDLAHYGGELALDEKGELMLSGNPGLSATIRFDLEAIKGKPVMIPLFRSVTGTGNNSKFIIVKFVGVRVMAVSLTSETKFVSVQPAKVSFRGSIQGTAGVLVQRKL